MAKQRIVNTQFWRDNYILTLKPYERLLFLWVITNPATELCGAYEVAMAIIELETGLKARQITEAFERFSRDGKIMYRDGWVIVRNFTKHQNGTSTNIKKAAARTLSYCPDWVKDTLSKGIGTDPKPTLPRPRPEPRPKPRPSEREGETPTRPPAPINLDPSSFEHPAVVIYQEKFHVKVRNNFAKAVAERVSDLGTWTKLIDDKIAWADEPLEKRNNIAKWILKAYDERIEEKRNGTNRNTNQQNQRNDADIIRDGIDFIANKYAN